MKRPSRPLFLARESYWHRRLMDASALLPILGLLLFMMPLLWSLSPAGERPGLAAQTVYLFVVWFALVAAAALISARLARGDAAADPPEEDGPG
jgi:uncharacterized membrane protein YozB (DUF420 family)